MALVLGATLALALVIAGLAWMGRGLLGPERAPNAASGALAGVVLGLVLASTRTELQPGLLPSLALGVAALAGAVGASIRGWVAPGIWMGALGLIWINRPSPTPALDELDEAVPSPPGHHVVLVTLDTFRADHLSAIGGAPHPVQTPNLDGLAAEGALYTYGVAHVPLTLPSHLSMLTGLEPTETKVVRNGVVVPEGTRTVAHELREAGYRTGAFVSSYVLRGDTGMAGGFEHYDDRSNTWDRLLDLRVGDGLRRLSRKAPRPSQRSGDQTIERALAWLESDDQPAFLWIHLYDAHAPYFPPEEFDSLFDDSAEDAPGNVEEVKASRERANPGAREFAVRKDLREPVANYAEEVAYVDHLVGEVLQALPADTRIVVAADHGESLTEHGEILTHGSYVWDTTLRVPIIVRAPELDRTGARYEAPVNLDRVGPTLRWLAGLPGTHARSLSGPIVEEGLISFAPGQTARFTLDLKPAWRVALRFGDVKWIYEDRTGRVQRYDLSADPEELEDTHLGDPYLADMVVRSNAIMGKIKEAAGKGTSREDDDLEALRALGYVE